MTTKESLLALARAVYPNIEWTSDGGGESPYVFDLYDGDIFDPANNDAQAIDVLCWLLGRDNCNEIDCDVVRFYPNNNPLSEPLCIGHDNTPQSLRAAILAAALRVVSE